MGVIGFRVKLLVTNRQLRCPLLVDRRGHDVQKSLQLASRFRCLGACRRVQFKLSQPDEHLICYVICQAW